MLMWSGSSLAISYNLDISRYNIARYFTQCNTFEAETFASLRPHVSHQYLALTGKLWVFFAWAFGGKVTTIYWEYTVCQLWRCHAIWLIGEHCTWEIQDVAASECGYFRATTTEPRKKKTKTHISCRFGPDGNIPIHLQLEKSPDLRTWTCILMLIHFTNLMVNQSDI